MDIKKYDQKMDFVNKNQARIEAELSEHADNFLQEHFNMRLNIPIKLNGRLTRALGRFKYQSLEGGIIEISKIACVEALLSGNNDTLHGILRHECIHYALWEKGLPNDDDSPYFISSCQYLNVPLSGVISMKQRLNEYSCAAGHQLFRARRVDTNKYLCECGEPLTYKGQVIR